MSITSNKIVTDCLCFEFERQIPVSPCGIYLPLEEATSHTHLYRVVWKHVFSSNVFPSDIKYFEFHSPSKPSRLIFSENFVCEETRRKIRGNTLHVSVYISVYLFVFIFLYLYFLISHSIINLCSYLRSFYRLCGLVVRVLGYRSGGPGLIPGTTGKKKSSGSGLPY
jgi:hypothetical protein